MSELIASALRRGDAESALSLVQELLAAAPDDAESHYWLAMVNHARHDGIGALAAIEQAIRLAPNRDDFIALRSVLQLGKAELTDVQADLMDALALNPNQITAYVGLIHIAISQNNLAEAERLLRLAERVDAEDDDVLVAKAAIFQKRDELDAALSCLNRALERKPGNVLALTMLCQLYARKEMPAFAEQALQRAVAIAPNNPAVLRLQVQAALDVQDTRAAETLLNALLAQAPADLPALALRSQIRQHHQDFAAAITDAQAWVAAKPDDLGALAHLNQLFVQQGDSASAIALIEQALLRQPDNDALWQLRCGIEAGQGDDGGAMIQRWLGARPESAMAHEAYAVYCEAQGNLAEAALAADKALAISEALPLAQFVKLRQEIRDNPEAALDRLVQLAPRAQAPEARRMVLAWIGMANDRLGQYSAAAEAFTRMAQMVLPLNTLPTPYPAKDVPDTGAEGRLLWAPAGVRIEPVLNALAPVLGKNLLADRIRPSAARDDGFGIFRQAPGHEQAGSALSWRSGIMALGLQPSEAVDWLPQWDAYTAAALAGTELTALIIDPRDALLNWLVFGSAQSYVFLPRIKQSALWLAAGYHALAETRDHGPQRVHIIKIDDLSQNAAAVADGLQQALALGQAPDAESLAKPVLALGGMPNLFPAGHWRHYRASFSEAFEVLTPLAVRLGYPQD